MLRWCPPLHRSHTQAHAHARITNLPEARTMHLIVIIVPRAHGTDVRAAKRPKCCADGECSHLLHITLFDDDDDTTKGSAQSCFHFVFLIKESLLDDIGEKWGNAHELKQADFVTAVLQTYV